MIINDFYNDSYVDFASYDVYRKLASYVDGFKVTARKCYYTVNLTSSNDKKKVAQLSSLTAQKCFVYDTPINLSNGEQILIGNWAENFSNVSLEVECFDEKNGVKTNSIGYAARKTKEVDEIIEIEMENGEIFRCTIDHLFLTNKNGVNVWVEAQDLTEESDIVNI